MDIIYSKFRRGVPQQTSYNGLMWPYCYFIEKHRRYRPILTLNIIGRVDFCRLVNYLEILIDFTIQVVLSSNYRNCTTNLWFRSTGCWSHIKFCDKCHKQTTKVTNRIVYYITTEYWGKKEKEDYCSNVHQMMSLYFISSLCNFNVYFKFKFNLSSLHTIIFEGQPLLLRCIFYDIF